ncbi:MAG: putative molybdenum carrier protein [Planctomycetota bacterium]
MSFSLEKVISGGQTGVDRAALDAAIEAGIACGGWCPRGRWSEAGPIDDRYPLDETPSAEPAERTDFNVRDADGTLIIAAEPLTGGSALTRRRALTRDKPCLVVDPGAPSAASTITRWLTDHDIRFLNVAGPRESGCPGIYTRALELLRSVLGG